MNVICPSVLATRNDPATQKVFTRTNVPPMSNRDIPHIAHVHVLICSILIRPPDYVIVCNDGKSNDGHSK